MNAGAILGQARRLFKTGVRSPASKHEEPLGVTQTPLTLRRWQRAEYERLVDLGVFQGEPIAVPRRAGLGIELDEAALARFPGRQFPARSLPAPENEGP